MADKYLNQTDLQEIGDWGYDQFAQKTELEALDKKVDDIVAEGGEPNVIEKVKLNGTEQTITNKEVNLEVPRVSMQGYDDMSIMPASGSSGFSFNVNTDNVTVTTETGTKTLPTKEYVDNNGGKIDKIKVNGTEQTITNKEVDLTVAEMSSEEMGDTGKADSVSIYNKNCGFAINKNGTVSLLGSNNRLDHQFDIVDRAYADATYRTEQQVQDAIDAHIGSAYKAKGSIAFANLPAPAANVEGFVYNVTDGFTTTADFVEGAGNKYPAGTDVVIINNGTDEEPEYKYNALTGVTDLSNLWTSQPGQSNTLEAMTVAEVRAILYKN